MKIYLPLLLSIFTSCSMYKRNFDCCPTTGMPCTSVTTLEKMIVESPGGGPETFLGCVPKLVDVQSNPTCKCTTNEDPEEPFQRRIWVAGINDQPMYLYFHEEDPCEEQ